MREGPESAAVSWQEKPDPKVIYYDTDIKWLTPEEAAQLAEYWTRGLGEGIGFRFEKNEEST